MPSINHIHKYRRGKLGKSYVVYSCVLPDCTHYLPEDKVVGKKSICWVCEKVTTVYKDKNGVLAKPHCKTCTKSKMKEDDLFDLPPLLNIPNIMP
jgi:hypothetical protein